MNILGIKPGMIAAGAILTMSTLSSCKQNNRANVPDKYYRTQEQVDSFVRAANKKNYIVIKRLEEHSKADSTKMAELEEELNDIDIKDLEENYDKAIANISTAEKEFETAQKTNRKTIIDYKKRKLETVNDQNREDIERFEDALKKQESFTALKKSYTKLQSKIASAYAYLKDTSYICCGLDWDGYLKSWIKPADTTFNNTHYVGVEY